MDIDRILDLERRTGVKDADIEEFNRKASDVEAAIKGLMDGTLDPKDIKIEGIETEEEAREKEIKREKLRKEQAEKAAILAAQRKIEERERWWAGADFFVRKRESNASVEDEEGVSSSENQIAQRYSMDYSRWDSWTPQDPATRAEREAQEAEAEKKRNEEFEKANPEFCNQFLADKAEREKALKKKETSADVARLKGNRHFQRKEFDLALDNYMEALKLLPYDVKTLTNIAQVLIKQLKYEDALEFLSRTLYLEPCHVKALSRKAFVLSEQGNPADALQCVQEALKVEPQNVDLLTQCRDLQAIVKESSDEAKLVTLIKTSVQTDTSPLSIPTPESPTPIPTTAATSASSETAVSIATSTSDLDCTVVLLNACTEDIVLRARLLEQQLTTDQFFVNPEADSMVAKLSRTVPAEGLEILKSLPGLKESDKPNVIVGAALLINFPMLRVYLRTSSILKSIVLVVLRGVLDYLIRNGIVASSPAVVEFAGDLLAFVCAGIREERSSKMQVLDSQILHLTTKSIIFADGILHQSRFLANVLQLIVVTSEDDICPKSQKHIHSNRGTLLRIGNILGELCVHYASVNVCVSTAAVSASISSEVSQTSTVSVLDIIMKVCNILKSFASSIDGKSTLSAKEDVGLIVLSVGLALHVFWEKYDGLKKARTQILEAIWKFQEDIIEKLVEVSLLLSQFEGLRKFFGIQVPAPPVLTAVKSTSRPKASVSNSNSTAPAESSAASALLALIRGHSVHTVNCLAVLINACLDPENVVRAEVERIGGADIAINGLLGFQVSSRITEEDDDLVRNRYAALISRFIQIENVAIKLSTPASFRTLCKELKFVMGSTETPISAERSKWRSEEVGHLVRIIAGLAKPSGDMRLIAVEEGLFMSVLSLLPMPRLELGEITPSSVILPPATIAPVLLLGNAARVLLQYADDPNCAAIIFGQTDVKSLGVEKLICTMASCTDIRVRKNIAIVLAKGCRLAPVREKVQFLRGMQMIIELQDKLT